MLISGFVGAPKHESRDKDGWSEGHGIINEVSLLFASSGCEVL